MPTVITFKCRSCEKQCIMESVQPSHLLSEPTGCIENDQEESRWDIIYSMSVPDFPERNYFTLDVKCKHCTRRECAFQYDGTALPQYDEEEQIYCPYSDDLLNPHLQRVGKIENKDHIKTIKLE